MLSWSSPSRAFALLRDAALLCTFIAASAGTAAAQRSSSPPERWVGTWRGTLQNLGAGDSVKLTVPVTLTIARTSDPAAFRWRHVYANDSTKNVKDYTLKVVDAAAGKYLTDENNGILIDESFVGGMLVSVFSVADQYIENRTSVRGDTLVQELIAWKNTPLRTSGGAGPNGERGMPVSAFRVSSVQRGVLVRVSP